MSLTAALAILAGVVLAAVVAQGAWRARQAGPRRQAPPPAPPRVEPAIGGGGGGGGSEDHGGAAGEGIAPAAAGHDGVLRPLPRSAARRPARIDGLIDAIATLKFEAPVSGEFVLGHLPPTRRAGSKPMLIEGLEADGGDWEAPAAGRRYRELQAAVLMASRSGALNEIEFSEFAQIVQALGESLNAAVELPDMLDVVARARELDGFAGQHDAQIAATLHSGGVAWSVGYIQQAAARHGFVPGAVAGRLVLPAAEEGAPPLLVLSFDAQAALAEDPHIAAVREVVLSLDVPQSPESAEPFPAWQQAARGLADDMGAQLLDDQGRPITLHAFAAIGHDLQQLYRALEARELAAGSPAARRVFS